MLFLQRERLDRSATNPDPKSPSLSASTLAIFLRDAQSFCASELTLVCSFLLIEIKADDWLEFYFEKNWCALKASKWFQWLAFAISFKQHVRELHHRITLQLSHCYCIVELINNLLRWSLRRTKCDGSFLEWIKLNSIVSKWMSFLLVLEIVFKLYGPI